MIKSGILLTDDDAKKVGKMMDTQVVGLAKDRDDRVKTQQKEQQAAQELQQQQQLAAQQQQQQQQQVWFDEFFYP